MLGFISFDIPAITVVLQAISPIYPDFFAFGVSRFENHWPRSRLPRSPPGELLASFELYCKVAELPFLPPMKKGGQLYYVPSGIRPVLQRTAVEVGADGGVGPLLAP